MLERAELQLSEEMGAMFERAGSPRMAGRVWGLLLIARTEHVSASELSEALQAAPSTISGATRFLVGLGLIERIRKPGERRDYFTVHHGAILNLARRRIETMVAARDMAARALDRFGDREVARPHLEELHAVYAWFADQTEDMLDRFSAERSTATAGE